MRTAGLVVAAGAPAGQQLKGRYRNSHRWRYPKYPRRWSALAGEPASPGRPGRDIDRPLKCSLASLRRARHRPAIHPEEVVVVRIPKRWLARATKQFAAIAIATAAVVAVTAGPASAVYDFSQGFEHGMDSSWHWDGVDPGSALWYNDTCGQARTGCGGVLFRTGTTGFRTLYTTV